MHTGLGVSTAEWSSAETVHRKTARQKYDESSQPEARSFSVDPQITSLDVLQHILVRAFQLSGKRAFLLSYLSRDERGQDVYLSLLSEWDLRTAFAAARPYLHLKLDLRPRPDSPGLEDWDVISPRDVPNMVPQLWERRPSALGFTHTLISQVGRTLSRMQQALSGVYGDDSVRSPVPPPLSDAEFRAFLGPDGQLARPQDLRLRVYHGGIEPSLRKVVWRHLLNVYPNGLSATERLAYMRRKATEYEDLCKAWQAWRGTDGPGCAYVAGVEQAVLKDVLRTDRGHPFFAGSDDCPRIVALRDLLVTFALTHPSLGYVQGMSDLASPLLFVMEDDARAYVSFCGLMRRLNSSFRPDGKAMAAKFSQLAALLHRYDPAFHAYLTDHGAGHLFFCYRWLLLELKREFAFDDALRALEVMWGALPPDPPFSELQLTEPEALPFEETLINQQSETTGSPSSQSSTIPPFPSNVAAVELAPQSSFSPPVLCPSPSNTLSATLSSPEQCSARVTSLGGIAPPSISECNDPDISLADSIPSAIHSIRTFPFVSPASSPASPSANTPSASSPLPILLPHHSPIAVDKSCTNALPPPQDLGAGNPLLPFLCVAMLQEQRDAVISARLDHNDLAIHFDRLVRRHPLVPVLRRARTLFAEYLRAECWLQKEGASGHVKSEQGGEKEQSAENGQPEQQTASGKQSQGLLGPDAKEDGNGEPRGADCS
uniref:TBC1 domain family member 25 isoform X2 n=1 Tax=Myxine glutinosa TaxID=7769 RepID=UPI00358FC360